MPAVHYLESWSDARAFDGTATIIQPLVEPLYKGKSAHEMLSVLLGKPDATPHDLVKGYWQSVSPNGFDDILENFIAQRRGGRHGGRSAECNAERRALPPLTPLEGS